jgi:phage/plasmid-like protein (TIGR03299 family)
MSDMVEALAYAGDVPWHSKGTRLASRLGAQGMLQCAGLDWRVERRPVYVEGVEIPGYNAIVRVPHGNTLKITSEEYGIVQNHELADLAEAMSGKGVQAWEVAGCLDEGKRVFFCGVLGNATIAGDVVREYLTVASSHDCSMSVTAGFSPIRVVCNNTLQAFINDESPRITIRHTKRASDKVRLATTLCVQARRYFGVFNAEAVKLVGAYMSVAEAVEIAEALFPAYKSQTTGDVVTPALRGILVDIFRGLGNIPHDRHIAGSKWGFYQAVTATLDHNRRGGNKSRLSRFLTGSDDALRSQAWRLLTGK